MRARSLESLYFFTVAVLGYNKLSPRLHLPYCKFLEDRSRLFKLTLMPRGYFKTTIGTKAYVLWRIVKNPNIRILIAFNTMTNAEAQMSEIMAHVETNARLQAVFPEIIPEFGKTTWTKDRLIFPREVRCSEGTIDAAGVSTDLASRHYNLIIEDDPIAAKRDQMRQEELIPSIEDIEKGIGLHRMLYALWNPPEPGLEYERLVHGTRWGVNDLAGWILENEPQYATFIRSAENDEGESAYPELKSTEELHALRDVQMGPYIYASQMLLKPISPELQTFRPDWLEHIWHDRDLTARRYILVDPCHKGTGTGSKSGVVVADVTASGHVDIQPSIAERTEPDKLIRIVLALVDAESWENPLTQARECPAVVLEDVAGQHILKPYLFEKMRPERPFQILEMKVTSRQGKDARIAGLTPWASAGRLRFPATDGGALFVRWDDGTSATFARSAARVREQLFQHPFGRDKDLADALAMLPGVASFPSAPTLAQPRRDPHSAQVALEAILARRRAPEAYPTGRFWESWEESRREAPLVAGAFGGRLF